MCYAAFKWSSLWNLPLPPGKVTLEISWDTFPCKSLLGSIVPFPRRLERPMKRRPQSATTRGRKGLAPPAFAGATGPPI